MGKELPAKMISGPLDGEERYIAKDEQTGDYPEVFYATTQEGDESPYAMNSPGPRLIRHTYRRANRAGVLAYIHEKAQYL